MPVATTLHRHGGPQPLGVEPRAYGIVLRQFPAGICFDGSGFGVRGAAGAAPGAGQRGTPEPTTQFTQHCWDDVLGSTWVGGGT